MKLVVYLGSVYRPPAAGGLIDALLTSALEFFAKHMMHKSPGCFFFDVVSKHRFAPCAELHSRSKQSASMSC